MAQAAEFIAALRDLQGAMADLDGDGVPDALQGGSGLRTRATSPASVLPDGSIPESQASAAAQTVPGGNRYVPPRSGPEPGTLNRLADYWSNSDAGDMAVDALNFVGGVGEGLQATGIPAVAPVGVAGAQLAARAKPAAEFLGRRKVRSMSPRGNALNQAEDDLSNMMFDQDILRMIGGDEVLPFRTLDENMLAASSRVLDKPASRYATHNEKWDNWARTGSWDNTTPLTYDEKWSNAAKVARGQLDDAVERRLNYLAENQPIQGSSGIPNVRSPKETDRILNALSEVVTSGPQSPSVRGRQGAISVDDQLRAIERYLRAGGSVPTRSGPWGNHPIGREDVMRILEQMAERGEI